MACDRFTRELKDHALGAPLETRAAAHLAVCSACQALFARETRLVASIDTAIEQVGSARPAAAYQVRLRESVSLPAQSTRARWYLAAAVVAASALLIVVGGAGWPRQRARHASDSRPPSAPIDIIKDTTPARIAVESTHRVAAAGQPAGRRRAHPGARSTPRADELDVLVPAGQAAIIARLLVSLRAQEPGVAAQLVGRTVTRTGIVHSADAPVSVAPILVKAVDVPDLLALEPVRAN